MDVIFIGTFNTGDHYGHMDQYLSLFKVYKVEAIQPARQEKNGGATTGR
jgi:hypothetical protein